MAVPANAAAPTLQVDDRFSPRTQRTFPRAVRHIHAVATHAPVVVETVMHSPTKIRRQHAPDSVTTFVQIWPWPTFLQGG
jgi:hypothetical protein